MAGCSPHFDRSFLKVHLPGIEACFNHRSFDISTLRQAAALWGREKYVQRNNHRALQDCFDALAELRHYRDQFNPIRWTCED